MVVSEAMDSDSSADDSSDSSDSDTDTEDLVEREEKARLEAEQAQKEEKEEDVAVEDCQEDEDDEDAGTPSKDSSKRNLTTMYTEVDRILSAALALVDTAYIDADAALKKPPPETPQSHVILAIRLAGNCFSASVSLSKQERLQTMHFVQ